MKVAQKNWSIEADSLRVHCLWKGTEFDDLNCENEELFVFLLAKKYIFLEGTIVELGNYYSKIKVQLDVFLTEEVIMNPLNMIQTIGRKRRTEDEESEDDEIERKESQQGNQILKLTKESFIKLFALLKVKVNIPSLVDFRQKVDPFQKIQKGKYEMGRGSKKRKYLGPPAKLITDDFPQYYSNKKKEKIPIKKRKNEWMFEGKRSPDCLIIDLEEDSLA